MEENKGCLIRMKRDDLLLLLNFVWLATKFSQVQRLLRHVFSFKNVINHNNVIILFHFITHFILLCIYFICIGSIVQNNGICSDIFVYKHNLVKFII